MKLVRAPLAVGVGIMVLAGCDLPTDTPSVEQRWIIPVETTSIGVDELLPSGVTVSGSSFDVQVDPFNTDENLGTLCSACLANNLTTAPKPAFDHTFSVSQFLPGDVVSATVASGTVAVAITHNLGFDPIQPPGGSAGTLTITVRNGTGGTAIGQLVLNGATESFPSGTTLNRDIELGSATIGTTLSVEVTVDSPAGGNDPANWVPINTSNTVSASVTPTSVLLSSVTVNVGTQTVDLDAQDVDLEDIDDSITDHIQQGGVILDVSNPFGISVSGTLSIGTVTKSLDISSSASSEVSISYTADELKSFIGKPNIQISGSGSISAAAPLTVSPGQEITLKASVDLTVLLGNVN